MLNNLDIFLISSVAHVIPSLPSSHIIISNIIIIYSDDALRLWAILSKIQIGIGEYSKGHFNFFKWIMRVFSENELKALDRNHRLVNSSNA